MPLGSARQNSRNSKWLPKKKLVEKQAETDAPTDRSQRRRAVFRVLNISCAEAAKISAEMVEKNYDWMDQVSARWTDGTATQEDLESVFVTFTSYPTMLASLIRDEECRSLPVVSNALDSLHNAHEQASEILSALACRFSLNGGLIEVSGEHCRKVLRARSRCMAGQWGRPMAILSGQQTGVHSSGRLPTHHGGRGCIEATPSADEADERRLRSRWSGTP